MRGMAVLVHVRVRVHASLRGPLHVQGTATGGP